MLCERNEVVFAAPVELKYEKHYRVPTGVRYEMRTTRPHGVGLTWCEAYLLLWLGHCASRALIELLIRRRPLAIGNIHWEREVVVRDLVHRDGRVRGVRSEDSRVFEAELTVDATGRTSRTPQWLAALGFPTPDETTIGLDIGRGLGLIGTITATALLAEGDGKVLYDVSRRSEGTD